jgi:hypothetical protein
MRSLSRRDFLELTALAAAGSPALAAPAPKTQVRPEFQRTMERVLICVPADSGSRDESLPRFLRAAFLDVLGSLPSYAGVEVAVRKEDRDLGLELTKGREARVHVVDEPGVEIELWAQDLGEPILRDGRGRFLVSRTMSASSGEPGTMSRNRKRVAEVVFGEDSVDEASFVFEGGNLAFDDPRGAARVLVGYNDVSRSQAAEKALGRNPSRREVLDAIGAAFGGVEVVEMGDESQSRLLQHIDLAFVILEGGHAVVCRIEDGGLPDESRQLARHAGQLRELGYQVSFLDHQASDLESVRSSVNVVPFKDRTTGERRVLLPVFPGEVSEEARLMTREALRGKAARAFDLYRDLGLQPSPVRDVTHRLGGNTHCILNVLA